MKKLGVQCSTPSTLCLNLTKFYGLHRHNLEETSNSVNEAISFSNNLENFGYNLREIFIILIQIG